MAATIGEMKVDELEKKKKGEEKEEGEKTERENWPADEELLECGICKQFGCYGWAGFYHHLSTQHKDRLFEWRGISAYLLIAESRLL